jgi:hypothetical protein
MIEKAVRQFPDFGVSEIIFEYALCMDCAMRFNNAISEETRQRISNYFSSCENFGSRQNEFSKRKSNRVQQWISRCVVKGTLISKSSEYQLIGQCDGEHLVLSELPLALSSEAMDEISGLMSEKSLGEIDDFIGNYFTGPPEVAELLKRKLVLF